MNPSKEEYIAFTKEQSIQEGENIIEKGLYSIVVGPVMDLATTSEDYLFFSRFKTDLGEGEKFEGIEVFNHFFTIGDNAFEISKDEE